MARITNASDSWQSVTLAADEIWQTRQGAVLLDTDASAPDREGLLVQTLEAVRFASGKTVYYRLASGTSAVIARVAV